LVERIERSGRHWWSPARPRNRRLEVASFDPTGENAQLRSADLAPASNGNGRPRLHANGKFLFDGNEKLYVRGTTYGTFAANENGDEFPCAEVVTRDFAAMAATGINAVRTYTAPPRWLLDAAQAQGLKVMVGLAAERYVGYLNDGRAAPDVGAIIRAHVRECADHPAILCYAIGNEIPAPVVRWFGRRRIESWLRQLCGIVRSEDSALVTYINYPSTEYLQLPFLDIDAYNVYLEEPHTLEAYLARLQNRADGRPLLLAELGLDSIRNGEECQSSTLAWQLRTTFALGCAGAFVYAWTDEWNRGGEEVHDWAFGLTDRSRQPKPALRAVSKAYSEVPFAPDHLWPSVSVIVCCFNGESTLENCLSGLEKLEYPDVEVIVIDDGSTDTSAAIAARHPNFKLVSQENRGLGNARNLGLELSTGEIVAYIDCDAWPDPHWLHYLVSTFAATTHACVGGPNLPPAGDPPLSECVSQAPGGPNHVLLSDREAEHVPGCNMAFRAAALREIGGFDPRFRVAGDDVDVCWQIQDRGWTIGFSPAAVVWHHRRDTLKGYWKQQVGYGKAEALLEVKWPEKYNVIGHASWGGRVYGGIHARVRRASRVYHGVWGTAPFQSLEERRPTVLSSLPLVPEWWLVVVALAAASVLGIVWTPLLFALPLLCLAVTPLFVEAVRGGRGASFPSRRRASVTRLRVITGVLHFVQPLARLRGRLRVGLTPWRRRAAVASRRSPMGWTGALWSESRRPPDRWVEQIESSLLTGGNVVARGGAYDPWDLTVRNGGFGTHRLLVAVEEHGGGRQLVRFRSRPGVSRPWAFVALGLVVLTAWAASDQAWLGAAAIGGAALLVSIRMVGDCALASGALRAAVRALTADVEGSSG
jgi:O-antigen biosynthesis protein